MKRNNILLVAALVVVGIAFAPLHASAQQKKTPAAKTNKPAPKASTNAVAVAPAPSTPTNSVETRLSEAIKAIFPDATISGFKKEKTVGTNEIYTVDFTSQRDKMRADVTGDGTLLKTEEPADIRKFPPAAYNQLIKVITGVGVKETGIKIWHTYAELRDDGSGGFTVVQLPAPLKVYGSNVQDNHAQPGKYGFTAEGVMVERPSWAR